MKLPSPIQRTVEQASTIDFAENETHKKRIHVKPAFKDFMQLIVGGLILAVAIALFIAPHNIAPGGSSGAAIIINNYVSLPIGILMLIFNIPAFFLGYRQLGGSSFLVRSLIATLAYNLTVDAIGSFVPNGGITDELILNAIFGGIVGGLGVGLIYRAGGVAGAGGVLTRLLQQKLSWPISSAKLMTNGVVVTAAGFVFGWEAAMYAVISFFTSGTTADFVIEGPDVVQTAFIITDRPQQISRALASELERGVSQWTIEGSHSRKTHAALYCTVTRPQISTLKNVIAAVDKQAFMIISQGHEAVGKGFKPHKWRPPVIEQVEISNESTAAAPAE